MVLSIFISCNNGNGAVKNVTIGPSPYQLPATSALPEDLKDAFKNQIEVESIDFSKFVIDNFNDRDYILCKMDIEGSEYDVLEKMIFDNSIDYIDHIIIEWHSNFFDNSSEMMERQIKIQKILTDRNIKVENWK